MIRGARKRLISTRYTSARPAVNAARGIHLACCVLAVLLIVCGQSVAQAAKKTVVFFSEGFPAADSPAPVRTVLQRTFADAKFADEGGLDAALNDPETSLLILPYGSAFPEANWKAILLYLEHGGNLLVVGGQPFSRSAYQDAEGWHLRAKSTGESLELFIDGYEQTHSSDNLRFEPNEDFGTPLASFQWKRSFSPVLRLSITEKYPREGPMGDADSTGDIDGHLTSLAWGTADGHRLATPAIVIDHDRQRFVGGRWVFLNCEPLDNFYESQAEALLPVLASIAVRRGDRFELHPQYPLFVQGEPLALKYEMLNGTSAVNSEGDKLQIRVTAERGGMPFELTTLASKPITLPVEAASGEGFHTIEAKILRNGRSIGTYRSGFWMRDLRYLTSGPKLTVGPDYFQLDGQPLPVVGTTYMSSEVQRLFLMRPNAWIWKRDMGQIRSAGLNMLRTGIWNGHEDLVAADGSMTEGTLRAMEAFLMSARHFNLPVQFTLFAFVPAFDSVNPYLDRAANAKQDRYVSSAVDRFRDVPFLAWDLINEPSANRNAFHTLPEDDALEQSAWKSWLQKRYHDTTELANAWAVAPYGMGRVSKPQRRNYTPQKPQADIYALPREDDFGIDRVRAGYNPLRAHDYYLFTQDVFTAWTKGMRTLIRGAGSRQLITVGQEEYGVASRLAPVFYGDALDFTCDHTWWDFDGSLWASLAAKLPGKPMLIQETGLQRRLTQDNQLRFSSEVEAAQLERKLAFSFASGAGAIHWLWNINFLMGEDDEVDVGAVRPDGSEKPDAAVLRGFARFAEAGRPFLTIIVPAEIAMIEPQVLQYSEMNEFAVAVQKHALRALTYYDHLPARMVAENRIGTDLGAAKLAILPSPQALSDAAWQQLLDYVHAGGTLLLTGPVDRNENWGQADRMKQLGLSAVTEQISVRHADVSIPSGTYSVSYPRFVQEGPLERLRFADGRSFMNVPYGAGKILWFADPVEFSEEYESAAAVYIFAAASAQVPASIKPLSPLSPAVLAFPTILQDAVLYSFSNETFRDQQVDFEDRATSAHIHFSLRAQGGAVLLLRKSDGQVIASYGIDDVNPGIHVP